MRSMRQERRFSPGMHCCDASAVSPLCCKGHSYTGKCVHALSEPTHTAALLLAGNSTVRCWDHAFSGPRVSLSIFHVCPRMRARRERRVSILFLSAVCMVCCFELDGACVTSGCRATSTIDRRKGTMVSDAAREEHTE